MARQDVVEAFQASAEYQELVLSMWNELDQASRRREREEREAEQAELRAGLHLNANANANLDGGLDLNASASTSAGGSANAGGSKRGWLSEALCLPEALRDDDGVLLCMGKSSYTTGVLFQMKVLLLRQVALVLRSPTVRVKLGRAVFQGVLLGTLFFQVSLDQTGANSRFGLLFLSISTVIFGAMAVIPELFAQREVYYAQKSAGYFRPVAYMLSLFPLVELPIVVLETFIYSTLVYGLCGLQGGVVSWGFIYFWLTMVQMQVTAWLLCLAVVMASPTAVVAQAVVPTFVAVWSLFSGYLVPKNSLAPAVRWLWDVSPMSRSLKGLAINEVTGLAYHCTPDQLFPPLSAPLLNVSAPHGFNGPAYRMCALASGESSLYLYDFNAGEQDKWVLFLENMVFPIALNLVLLLIMLTVHYEADSSDAAGQLLAARKRSLFAAKDKFLQEHRAASSSSGSGFAPAAAAAATSAAESASAEVPLLPSAGSSSAGSPSEVPQGCIEFDQLSYSVDIPQGRFKKPKQKQLLHNISGYATPGGECFLFSLFCFAWIGIWYLVFGPRSPDFGAHLSSTHSAHTHSLSD